MKWIRQEFIVIKPYGAVKTKVKGWSKNGLGIVRQKEGIYEIYHLRSGLKVGHYYGFKETKEKAEELFKIENWRKDEKELSNVELMKKTYNILEMRG